MRFLALLVGLCISTGAWANIGTVTELSGAAVIKRGKDTVTVAKGTVVEQNDKVETKNGKLKIVFVDDTQVSVTEHSSLVIDDFVYDPKSKSGRLGLKAASGTVRYVSGAIAKDPKAVNIKTPTAAIAVRGTDFVMSVNEVGGSMVILMPTCDWQTSAVKGMICGSGKIDVESGPTMITMDRPYQATLVETAGAPPTPPITVNLFNTPVGNNLQIAPPRTMGGAGLVAAARAAAAATGVTREAKREEKDDKDGASEEKAKAADKRSTSSSARRVAGRSSGGGSAAAQEQTAAASQEEAVAEEKTVTQIEEPKVETDLAAAVVEKAVSSVVVIEQSKPVEQEKEEVKPPAAPTIPDPLQPSTESDNPNVKKLWRDNSQLVQTGWLYESLSPTNRNYAQVKLPIDTKAQVIITQDGQTNSYNFAAARAQGQIVINQTFR